MTDVPTPERRRFLTWLSLGLSGVIAGALGIPILGYLLGPLIRPAPAQWQDLGSIGEYVPGTTVLRAIPNPTPLPWAGRVAETAVWVQRGAAEDFVVFSVHCTHLGCPVNWLPDARLFMCPCHGGVYYEDGTVAAGPPPRELFRHEYRVRQGRLEVQTLVLPTAR